MKHKGNNCRLMKVAVGLVLCLSVSVGTTAATITDGETKVNTFSVSSANLDFSEPKWENLDAEDKVLYPDRTVVKDPTITNNGHVPLFVFARVQIPIVNVKTVSQDGRRIIPATPQLLVSYVPNEDWHPIISSQSSSVFTVEYMYVKGSLAPGEKTTPVFNEVKYLNVLEGEIPAGTSFDVVVHAMGIQSEYICEDDGGDFESQLREIYIEHRNALVKTAVQSK